MGHGINTSVKAVREETLPCVSDCLMAQGLLKFPGIFFSTIQCSWSHTHFSHLVTGVLASSEIT